MFGKDIIRQGGHARKRSALIIGVSGQDGGYLANFLLEKGYQVYGTSRDHEIAAFSNLVELGIKDRIHLMSMTLADFRSVVTALQTAQPDEIYNLGGNLRSGFLFVIQSRRSTALRLAPLTFSSVYVSLSTPPSCTARAPARCSAIPRNLPTKQRHSSREVRTQRLKPQHTMPSTITGKRTTCLPARAYCSTTNLPCDLRGLSPVRS